MTRYGTDGEHQFSAVSTDGKIIAASRSHSGTTSGANLPSAKIDRTYAEIYFLSLAEAEKKLLVLTDPEFFEIFSKRSDGKIPSDIEIVYCPLPDELRRVALEVRVKASAEMDTARGTRMCNVANERT